MARALEGWCACPLETTSVSFMLCLQPPCSAPLFPHLTGIYFLEPSQHISCDAFNTYNFSLRLQILPTLFPENHPNLSII